MPEAYKGEPPLHPYFLFSQNIAQMATACLRFLAVPFLITAGMQRDTNLTFDSFFFGAGIWFGCGAVIRKI